MGNLRNGLLVLGFTVLVSSCGAEAPPAAAARESPPDLSGVWMAFAVVNPDGGGNAPRYSPEGEALLAGFAAQYSTIPETGAWCYGTGMPSVMLSTVSYPIEIVQHASRLVMLAELEMQVRRVYLDGREHPVDFLPTGVGHSVGTFDGDNDDVLVVEMTVTDPVYDGPQRRTAYFQRMADTATLEYSCSAEHWLAELEKNRVTDWPRGLSNQGLAASTHQLCRAGYVKLWG
jgi:hypothetical protein